MLCCLLLLGAAALAPAQNLNDERDAANARQLLEEGLDRLRSGNPGMARVTFETLVAVYPESSLVDQAKDGIRAAEEQEGQAPIVSSIRYLGFKKVKFKEIVQRLRDREARLDLEQPCDERCIDEAQSILAEFLTERGYPKSRVRTELHTVSARSIEITFTLVKG